ncbi:MAG: phosphatase PAP2 family protein [Nitrospinota bacterium]|nr:MAG: phosphatase PAP2 family protein [Nitrospinota bacterium]
MKRGSLKFRPIDVAIGIGLCSFSLLALWASQRQFWIWDYWVRETFQAHRFPGLYAWMHFLTRFGEGIWIAPLLLLSMIFLWWQEARRQALFFLLYTITFAPLPTLLKLLVSRPRPKFVTKQAATGYGFPSGHAFAALAFYGLLAYLASKRCSSRPIRWLVISLCIAIILAVGASRLYLQKHWLSDVIGAYLGAGTYLLLAIRWLESSQDSGGEEREAINDDVLPGR